MRSLGEIVNHVTADIARSRGIALHAGLPDTAFESEAAFLTEAQAWLQDALGGGETAEPCLGERRPLAA